MTITNLGCIGHEGLTVDLDNILCLVGQNNSGKSTILRAYELAVGAQVYSHDKDYCKKSTEKTTIEISVIYPKGLVISQKNGKRRLESLQLSKVNGNGNQMVLKTEKHLIQNYKTMPMKATLRD